jgi:hypothetical protein
MKFGLVAQSGRAPGFYSARATPINGAMRGFKNRGLLNEKIPDGRGFKSLRARSVLEETA